MSNFYSNRNSSKYGATEIIIIINVILFIPYFFRYLPFFKELFVFSRMFLNINVLIQDMPCINNGAVWQVLTAMFMHANITHLFFNMYALYAFGKRLEIRWGEVQFTLFYLTVGVLANVASAVLFVLLGQPTSLLGASGAVFGILLAYGGYYPDTQVLLFFFLPIKVKWCILLYAAIELGSELSSVAGGMHDRVAHCTHLFGFLFAFLYLLIFFKCNPIKRMFGKQDDYTIY